MTEPEGTPGDVVDRRVAAVLSVAAQFRTEVPLADLTALLPEEGPADPAEMAAWVQAHPQTARITDARVHVAAAIARSAEELRERRARGMTYFEAAHALVGGPFRWFDRLLRTVCVTGSTAYEVPLEGDDVDLMIVTRNGTLWLFLLLAFVALRIQRAVPPPSGAHWCMNYAMEERAAREVYARPSGFLFAREALTARPVLGGEYYGHLLLDSDWMALELPRLYATRRAELRAVAPAPVPTPRGIRLANAACFPIVAAFLHLKGLRENARLRRRGETHRLFATTTSWGQFSLRSARYDSLGAVVPSLGRRHAGEAPG